MPEQEEKKPLIYVSKDELSDDSFLIQPIGCPNHFIHLDMSVKPTELGFPFKALEGFHGALLLTEEKAKLFVERTKMRAVVISAKAAVEDNSNFVIDDLAFNARYPMRMRELAEKQWTPLAVAKKAAKFLANTPETKILDIGSGCGKFILIGAECTEAIFTGVEYREDLVKLSADLAYGYNLENAKFIQSNIMDIEFSNYNAFYFYNSFQEHIDEKAVIDLSVKVSAELFDKYTKYVFEQLSETPIGTRYATYHSYLKEIPPSFELQSSHYGGLLKFFIKTNH